MTLCSLSLNISNEMYRQLMLKADEEGVPVHDIMLRGIEQELRKVPAATESP